MVTAREFGLRVRELIAKGWCQEANAVNGEGCEVSARSENAVCFCISGACCRAGDELLGSTIRPPGDSRDVFWRALITATPDDGPVSWNDRPGRTQAEVLALVDTVIAKFPVAA